MGLLETVQSFHFNRCVTDYFEQLLMAPDIAFQRSDVEITNDHGWTIDGLRPACHPLQKIELLAELCILLAVGNVSACRDIDILQDHALASAQQLYPHMARFAIGLPVMAAELLQWNSADRRNSVIAFLSVHCLMFVSKLRKRFGRKLKFLAFYLLQAQHIRLFFQQEALHDRQAQADRVDIPGSYRDHGVRFRWVARQRQGAECLNRDRSKTKNPRPGGIGTRVLYERSSRLSKPAFGNASNRGETRFLSDLLR